MAWRLFRVLGVCVPAVLAPGPPKATEKVGILFSDYQHNAYLDGTG